MIAVARDRGMATVVIDKEGTIAPHDFDAEAKRIKDFAPFMSEHIFVWSERQREFWGKAGVDNGRITVIGQPRSDLLHHERHSDLNAYFDRWQPLITFFSYMDNAYIPVELIQAERLDWGEMRQQSYDEIYRMACVHPEFNFIIKTHPQQSDLDHLRQKYEREDLRIIGGAAVAYELLQRSELIIAFQTTVLIEAMLVGRRAIYTAWDPHVRDLQEHLLPFHSAGEIVVADSSQMLWDVADRFLSGDGRDFDCSEPEVARRKEFVSRYLYQADGHASERFLNALGRFLS
jgi:UDP-N-acetylglucosamine 2-epimerase